MPFEVVDGFVKTITVSIPWSSLITEDAAVEVHGLELTLQPKQRDTAGKSSYCFPSSVEVRSTIIGLAFAALFLFQLTIIFQTNNKVTMRICLSI